MKRKKVILINPSMDLIGLTSSFMSKFMPLGLAYIAAMTPKDWDVEILDENWEEAKFKECDVVGITAVTAQANRAYKIANIYRENKIPVIMGGIHASMVQDEALQHVDAIVVGEAENIWQKILEDVNKKQLQRIYKDEKEVDLEKLPLPAYELIDKKYLVHAVSTSRGCPMACEFCSVTKYNGYKYRQRSVNTILEELKRIDKKFIFFVDDNLVGRTNEQYVRFINLCKGMIELKLNKKWISQTSINIVENEDVLNYAAKSGCMTFLFGLEALDEKMLTKFKKGFNIKYIKEGNYINKLHKYKIPLFGSFIAGNENDSFETIKFLEEYVKKMRIDIPAFPILAPFPGTNLEKRLINEGKIINRKLPDDWAFYNTGDRAIISTKYLSTEQVNRCLKQMFINIYTIWAISKRALYTFYYTRNIMKAFFVFGMNYAIRHSYRSGHLFK